MKSPKTLRAFLLALAALCSAAGTHGQGGGLGSYSSPLVNNLGRPIPGADIAVCAPLATTGASVTGNVASLTMTSNPVTAGFVTGMQIIVAGFTGADTYFNGGSLANGQIVSGFTILSVTSTTITYTLVHANASASTNGTVVQEGNSSTSCAGLATVTSDPALQNTIAQPLVSDYLGNWAAFAAPGVYDVQFYGAGLTTTLRPVTISCVPFTVVTCGLGPGGSNTQVEFNDGGNLNGATDLLYNKVTGATSLVNPTAATGGANQSSPPLNFVDNYWNGSASAQCTITLQSVPGSGTNPGTLWTMTPSGCGPSGIGVNLTGMTGFIQVPNIEIVSGGGSVANVIQNGVSAGPGIALPLGTSPSANSFLHSDCGGACQWSYQNAPWSAFPVDQTGLTNTYSATVSPLLYDGATQYWITWDAKVTTPATTGAATSTLGPLTLGWTDPDGVAQSVTAAAQSKTGTIETSDTGNSTTTVLLGLPILMNSNNGSNTITISMGYASNTANQMTYNFHLRVLATR
jgi:hypothetical protein